MTLGMCRLKLQSDWPGLCSEPVSTVLPRCRCVFIIQHTELWGVGVAGRQP